MGNAKDRATQDQAEAARLKEIQEESRRDQSEANEPNEPKDPSGLKFKVISHGDYQREAKELLDKNNGDISGMKNINQVAVSLLMSRNEYAGQTVQIKGETWFVCKI